MYTDIRGFWKRLIRQVLEEHREELQGFQTFTRAVVHATQYVTRNSDADNYLWKILNDALVECRVIEDDSSDHILLIADVSVDRERAPGVEVVVFDDGGR